MWLHKLMIFTLIFAALGLLVIVTIGMGVNVSPSSANEEKRTLLTCGYDSCPKSEPNKLNIHLVPHTHDDVGWLKTVDQYYYGARTRTQLAGVQYILDSVIDALEEDPKRKFIYVETSFLWKWWKEQNEKRRDLMRKLIDEGRLEIVGGGWSMNDEAVTYYQSMIDQYTWGFRRLNDTFGSCARPKTGWQIDPFGHSREQASMFAQLGFDGMFFGRLDYQDKQKRINDKTGEFIWEASPSLGKSSNLFATMLYNFYDPPVGFCFDIVCADEPMMDDVDSPEYNIHKKLHLFLKLAKQQAEAYRTNNIILTMGGDFMYTYAGMYFKNMDKLIRYVNERNGTDFNAFYSTPSCYQKALNEANMKWPTKNDDFFPYSSDKHSFWTGYFSSRPALKFFERMGNNFLQIVKQLSVLTDQADTKELQLFREAMGILQHHDAVTGTAKQQVTYDYARILDHSMQKAAHLASKSLNKWAQKQAIENPAEFHSCFLLNISSCEPSTNNDKFVVTVYNPTSQPLSTFIRLPVRNQKFEVTNFAGNKIVHQMVPIPERVQNIPGREGSATMELIFQAVHISPLGFQSFFVNRNTVEVEVDDQADQPNDDIMDTNNDTVAEGETLLQRLSANNPSGISFELGQTFHYYEGVQGDNNTPLNRSSGAYIFRPKPNFIENLPNSTTLQMFTGPLVEEVHQVVNDWISQVIRIYNETDYVEFDWLVGPIPLDDLVSKEIITKYSTNLKNKEEFYTDSNGRQNLKRKLNHRPTWNLNLNEPISGNYYPVTSKISIQDDEAKLRFSVLTDRSQGGSSLKDGEIELMLHRRLLKDDRFGVNEALIEFAFGEGLVVRGQHYVLGGNITNIDKRILYEKQLATQLALKPWIFISPVQDSFEQWNDNYKMKDDGWIKSLPPNVRILTLEPWKDGEVLLRLEHLFEKGESPKYSVPVQINLNELFSGFKVNSVQETILGANMWVKDLHRMNWQPEIDEVAEADDSFSNDDSPVNDTSSSVVTLKPLEIRTFILKLEHGTRFFV